MAFQAKKIRKIKSMHTKIHMTLILSLFIGVTSYGRPSGKDSFDKIIQPFLTTKPTRQGTVLKLCYDLVEADGARFFIKLPKQTVTL